MSKGISNKTKKLTLGAILSAMGVALLFIGSFIETLDLTMAALASFFCIFAVIELGGAYPWLIFAVTGVLSVVLMPYSLTGWFYLLFFGYYPILKEKFEHLSRPISWFLKVFLRFCGEHLFAFISILSLRVFEGFFVVKNPKKSTYFSLGGRPSLLFSFWACKTLKSRLATPSFPS